jgi:hypothetical protein
MIPGTLRPLPKKLKEVKTSADNLMRTVELDFENTKDILKDSSLYTFEEIKYHHIRILEQLSEIIPLTKEADKLVDKHVNDALLSELVFNLFRKLEIAQDQLHKDSQRLETILMSKRKKHIEEMIPRIGDEIKSKLSFLKDLSFDEVLAQSQAYGSTISDIVGKLEALRDEYQKLASGSFDVSEFYGYLNEQLTNVEDELGQYDLILRTCKMQMLTEEAEGLVEEGNVVTNEFEQKQTSEQALKTDEYIKNTTSKLEEMINLRVSLPRRGVSKDFSNSFKELQQQFESVKNSLQSITAGLEEKIDVFATQIAWIKAIRDIAASDGEELGDTFKMLRVKGKIFDQKLMTIKEKEIRLKPKINLKGTFNLAFIEGNFPIFELSPLGLVKLPLGEELDLEKIEQILAKLDAIKETAFTDEIKNRRKANKLLKEIEQKQTILSQLSERISPAYNKVKNFFATQISKIKSKEKKVETPKEEKVETPKEEKEEEVIPEA